MEATGTWMPTIDTRQIEAMEPVSLGYACDLKYQISRNLYFRIHPSHTERQFRNMLFRWQRCPSFFRRHIFDWQITPFAAMCAYIRNDFQGVFERADLHVGEDGNAHHRSLLTIHPHDFSKGPDGRVTEAIIDAEYAQVRSKFDFLADRFRRHLETPGPCLYVVGEIRPLAEVEGLIDLLKSRNLDRRLHLLLVDKDGAVNQVLSRLRGTVSKGWLPHGCDKPADRQWEGRDDAWNAILDRFPIGLPDVPLAAPPTIAQGQFAAPPETLPLDDPPLQGWRALFDTGPADFRSVFDHVGDNSALAPTEAGLAFRGAGADDHLFCQYAPVRPGGASTWARVEFTWPAGHHRAGVILQDQDCYAPAHRWEEQADPQRSVLLARLGPEVDHIRLVMTPDAGGGVLPLSVKLEIHDEPQVPADAAPSALPRSETLGQSSRPEAAMGLMRSVLKRFSRA
jgi:hypothetical protein